MTLRRTALALSLLAVSVLAWTVSRPAPRTLKVQVSEGKVRLTSDAGAVEVSAGSAMRTGRFGFVTEAYAEEAKGDGETSGATLGLVAPIDVIQVHDYPDGGTLGFHLKDAQGKELPCCMDGRLEGREENVLPSAKNRQIFLGAAHPTKPGAKSIPLGGETEEALAGILQAWLDRHFNAETQREIAASGAEEVGKMHEKEVVDAKKILRILSILRDPARQAIQPAAEAKSQAEALRLAKEVDLPLLEQASRVEIEEAGGVRRTRIVKAAGDLAKIRQALTVGKTPPTGGENAAVLTFMTGKTVLRKVWIFKSGEWGFQRAKGTHWSTGKNQKLFAIIAGHLEAPPEAEVNPQGGVPEATSLKTALDGFQAPVELEVHKYTDGGTLGIKLADAKGRKLEFCLDGRMADEAWHARYVSRCIFLGGTHPDHGADRILVPGSAEEQAFVKALEALVLASLGKDERVVLDRQGRHAPPPGAYADILPFLKAAQGFVPDPKTSPAMRERMRTKLKDLTSRATDPDELKTTFGDGLDTLRKAFAVRILTCSGEPLGTGILRTPVMLKGGKAMKDVLDALALAVGSRWEIQEEAIVFEFHKDPHPLPDLSGLPPQDAEPHP